jgi:holo-[acyl-carrier protein] synthase
MLACGVDFILVVRIEETVARFGERFLDRVYTAAEQQYCAGRAAQLAARWAAKEAFAKALGVGIGDVMWREIEVVNDRRGAPTITLHGAAATLAERLGLREWAISLTHDDGRAVAMVVATG